MFWGVANHIANMQELVQGLERQFGTVSLLTEDGYTKLRVAGLVLTFPDAEKLCLGQTTIQALQK